MDQRTVRDVLVVAVVLTTVIASPIATSVNAMPAQPDSNEQSVHLIPPPPPDEQTAPTQTRSVVRQQSVSTASTLVVEKGNPNNFDSIQNAVENATDGDIVEVRPGTYREKVSFNKTLTLTAPSGATMNGSTIDTLFVDNAVTLEQAADGTVISGFTITDYGGDGIYVNTGVGRGVTIRSTTIASSGRGIDGDGTSSSITIRDSTLKNNDPANLWSRFGESDWTVENTTLRDAENSNIRIGINQPGNWTILNSTITGEGISAPGNTLQSAPEGDWTIRDTTISGSSGHAVNADENAKDWTIQNTTIDSADIHGVNADASTGNWTITNSIIKESDKRGIWAKGATGNWTVRNATITSNSDEGVLATDITGAWTFQQSRITNNTGNGINANNAAIEIDATQNWWGDASGPSDTDCVGNVDCSNWLTSPSGGTTSGNESQAETLTLHAADVPETVQSNSTFSATYEVENTGEAPNAYTVEMAVDRDNVTVTGFSGDIQSSAVDNQPPSASTDAIAVGARATVTIDYQVAADTTGNASLTAMARNPLAGDQTNLSQNISIQPTADAPDDPTQRALQITGKSDPSELTQNDVTATITRFERGQSVNAITVTQNDVTTTITLFERN